MQIYKTLITNLMIVLIGTITGLFLIECLLRIRQLVKYGTMEMFASVKFESDPHSGLRIPLAGAKTKSITINSHGFRGPELEDPKPKSRLRVGFLGASTTFCSEVSSDEIAWPHLVWTKLQKIYPSANIDYVNASVPGYTVSSSFKNLIHRVEPMEPDIILIYHAHNDLVANSRKLAEQQGLYHQIDRMDIPFLRRILFWKYLSTHIDLYLTERKVRSGIERLDFDLDEISNQYHKDLMSLVEYSKSVSEIVAIATFSYNIRREHSEEEKLKASLIALQNMPYMRIDGLIDGYEQYNRIIREVARGAQIILIDEELSIPANDDTFSDSIHFNDLGSRLMAERVVRGLETSEEFREFFKIRLQM